MWECTWAAMPSALLVPTGLPHMDRTVYSVYSVYTLYSVYGVYGVYSMHSVYMLYVLSTTPPGKLSATSTNTTPQPHNPPWVVLLSITHPTQHNPWGLY